MSSLNYYNLLKALYEKLNADSQLMAVVSAVYSHVPQDAIFPFIVISDVEVNYFSNLKSDSGEYLVNINVWSREAGQKQAADIIELLYNILQDSSVSVSGKNSMFVRIDTASIQLENDGVTYRGNAKLRVVL